MKILNSTKNYSTKWRSRRKIIKRNAKIAENCVKSVRRLSFELIKQYQS